MEKSLREMDDTAMVALIEGALDGLLDDRLRLDDDATRLALMQASLRLEAKLKAWQQRLVQAIDGDEVTWRLHRTSTATWLAETSRLTPRQAGRLIRSGHQLVAFPTVEAAATAGAVSAEQSEAITLVLADLAEELAPEAMADAQSLLVELAATHNSSELRRLGAHVLEVLAPALADEKEAERLEREYRAAQRNRYLEFCSDGRGSTLIRGSLPAVEAEPFVRIINAYAEADRRALDALDPQAVRPTLGMRRADALTRLLRRHERHGSAPSHGGDRPRIAITLSYDAMLRRAVADGLASAESWPPGKAAPGARRAVAAPAHRGVETSSGRPVPASVLRRLLCDADVLPVVLGGPSEVLDVGRTHRLVTPAIRQALAVRDGGCIFPGCDKRPEDCHAHHLTPWWAGGATALSNLVLVCPHHHGIVEPSHDADDDRWSARVPAVGPPEVLPPRRVDPHQRPRRHARFLTGRRSTLDPAERSVSPSDTPERRPCPSDASGPVHHQVAGRGPASAGPPSRAPT